VDYDAVCADEDIVSDLDGAEDLCAAGDIDAVAYYWYAFVDAVIFCAYSNAWANVAIGTDDGPSIYDDGSDVADVEAGAQVRISGYLYAVLDAVMVKHKARGEPERIKEFTLFAKVIDEPEPE